MISVAVLLSACAGGHLGTVAGRCIRTETACLIETRAVGVDLEAQQHDLGLTTGYHRTVRIYPKDLLDGKTQWKSWDGWRLIRVPLPEISPLKKSSVAGGIGMEANPVGIGFSAGVRQQSLTVLPVNGPGGTWDLHYENLHPERTRAHFSPHE
jgi:hypothetical protein